MTPGYEFSFSIYSLIHAILEVSSFVAFAQTPSFHFIYSISFCTFLIKFNLFLLSIYYRSNIILSFCILPGANPFIHVTSSSSRRNILLISVRVLLHTLCLSSP